MKREVQLEISLVLEVLNETLEFCLRKLFPNFDRFRRNGQFIFVLFHRVSETVNDVQQTELHKQVEKGIVSLEEGVDKIFVDVVIKSFLSNSFLVYILGQVSFLDDLFEGEGSAE